MLIFHTGEMQNKSKAYGELPVSIGIYEVGQTEMMFTQYLPIKLSGSVEVVYDARFLPYKHLIDIALFSYLREYGYGKYREVYVYLTAKNMYQSDSNKFNREGYHSDGFLTDDVNYIWSDCHPTVFNNSLYNLSLDDKLSLSEMSLQSDPLKEIVYENNSLLRLNQYCIHKVGNKYNARMRNFLKISISADKYDLEGNSHNYLLDYNWKMKKRKLERNIPQSKI